MSSIESKRTRSAYDKAFKLNVIEYAEANNNCAAAREFLWTRSKYGKDGILSTCYADGDK